MGKRSRQRDQSRNSSLIAGAGNGLTALVVDDDPMVCILTGKMLRRLGYTVHMFGTGSDALFHSSRAPTEFLLADYKMPEIDGYQLGRIIKSWAPQTRVAIMTELCQSAVAEIMKDEMIDAWLFKPFQIRDLAKVLICIGLPVNSGIASRDMVKP